MGNGRGVLVSASLLARAFYYFASGENKQDVCKSMARARTLAPTGGAFFVG